MVSALTESSHYWQVPTYTSWTHVSFLPVIFELLSTAYAFLNVTQNTVLQSLDRTVYKPLNSDYHQEATSYMRNYLQASIKKFNFVRWFSA
jgi:hypothetical protein